MYSKLLYNLLTITKYKRPINQKIGIIIFSTSLQLTHILYTNPAPANKIYQNNLNIIINYYKINTFSSSLWLLKVDKILAKDN